MLYTTHTYVATKVAGEDPLIVIGSTIPDLSYFFGTINSKKMHLKGREFKEYIQSEDHLYLPLAIGIMLHGETPEGLDFYTHLIYENERPGYAFRYGRHLIDKIKKLHKVELPLIDKYIAHNLIEEAVEFLMIKEHPETVKLLHDASNEVDKIKIVNYLSNFKPFRGITNEWDIINFYKNFDPNKFTTPECVAELHMYSSKRRLVNFMNKIIGRLMPESLKDTASDCIDNLIERITNREYLKELIEEAIKLSESSYNQFLDSSIRNMMNEIDRLD